jgi:Domain of unknown function (DUF4349)
MNTRLPIALAAFVLVSSCVSVPRTSLASPAARSTAPASTSHLPLTSRHVAHSMSLSLIVEDPVMALSRMQGAVLEAGGFVLSSSSWSSPGSPAYSNLSARVPAGSLFDLQRVALEMSLQVQSNSTYGQDVTFESIQLQQRLEAVTRAEDQLWRLAGEEGDPQHRSSYSLIHDLLEREKADLERQLADTTDRVAFAAFDVTLNQTSGQIFVE